MPLSSPDSLGVSVVVEQPPLPRIVFGVGRSPVRRVGTRLRHAGWRLGVQVLDFGEGHLVALLTPEARQGGSRRLDRCWARRGHRCIARDRGQPVGERMLEFRRRRRRCYCCCCYCCEICPAGLQPRAVLLERDPLQFQRAVDVPLPDAVLALGRRLLQSIHDRAQRQVHEDDEAAEDEDEGEAEDVEGGKVGAADDLARAHGLLVARPGGADVAKEARAAGPRGVLQGAQLQVGHHRAEPVAQLADPLVGREGGGVAVADVVLHEHVLGAEDLRRGREDAVAGHGEAAVVGGDLAFGQAEGFPLVVQHAGQARQSGAL